MKIEYFKVYDLKPIPIGVSVSHIHIRKEHLHAIYGEGYELTLRNDLTQKGEFAAEETVTLINETKKIENVRILGPTRDFTQVELSKTDAFRLGMNPPVRDSGNHTETPGLTIKGPKGAISISKGVILAMRHIHMSLEDARNYGVKNGEMVDLLCGKERQLIFGNVLIRVDESFVLDFHIDTDEANAADISTGDIGYLIKFSKTIDTKKETTSSHTLITEKDVLASLYQGNELCISKNAILTPLALDLARKHKLV
jgi:putative phosphotransacetylase